MHILPKVAKMYNLSLEMHQSKPESPRSAPLRHCMGVDLIPGCELLKDQYNQGCGDDSQLRKALAAIAGDLALVASTIWWLTIIRSRGCPFLASECGAHTSMQINAQLYNIIKTNKYFFKKTSVTVTDLDCRDSKH